MPYIELTRGKKTLVDQSDFKRVSQYKWYVCFDGYNWYARRKFNGQPHNMSNFILELRRGIVVDHKDRNTLNNRRNNLRQCSHAENMRNIFRPMRNRSGFKGVSWKKKNGKWCAQICVNWRVKHLGLFDDPRTAALAYDRAAKKEFGRFSLTNKKLGLLKK